MPRVAVFTPCKGIDPNFRDNMLSLLGQNYPDYEVFFVTESESDPAYHQIEGLLQEQCLPHANLLDAGSARGRGQKVHNLLQALDQVPDDVEVFVFADSDATPPSSWLRSLVAPLADPQVGAATGYRWYIPLKGNLCSLLQSLWNASIATALGPHRRNFAWGGSTAIRRETFNVAEVRQRWTGACSDDYALTKAVKDHGLVVEFVPQCLIPSRGGCRLWQLLQFTTRQMVITRVYSPRLWWLALVPNLVFFAAFYGGLAMMAWRWWIGLGLGALPVLVGFIYLLGVAKSILRQKAVELVLTEDRFDLKRYRLSYWFLFPLANLIFLYNLVVSAASRRIEWRGVRYKLISPTETLILGQD